MAWMTLSFGLEFSDFEKRRRLWRTVMSQMMASIRKGPSTFLLSSISVKKASHVSARPPGTPSPRATSTKLISGSVSDVIACNTHDGILFDQPGSIMATLSM